MVRFSMWQMTNGSRLTGLTALCMALLLTWGVADASPVKSPFASSSEPHLPSVNNMEGNQVKAFLNDPRQNWQEQDFILMNEEKAPEVGSPRLEEMDLDHLIREYLTVEALRDAENRRLAGNSPGLRARPSKRVVKGYSLSLTNNLDVLREKLYMEIARRQQLDAHRQIESANSALASMG